MDKKEDIHIELILLKRCTGDELSQEELLQLSIWLQDSQNHIDYYERMQNFPYKEDEHVPVDMDAALSRFLNNIEDYNASKNAAPVQMASPKLAVLESVSKKRFSFVGMAAAFIGALIVIGGLGYMALNYQSGSAVPKVETVQLITEHGPAVDLEDPELMRKNLLLGKNTVADNTLTYHEEEKAVTSELHTLITPENKHYVIVLHDSTRVSMNGGSELKYHVPFVGGKRDVYLKGEAYFEVSKGRNPFIVHSDKVQIKAYGTEFNVNTYHSGIVKAMLVEGSIGIKASDHAQETMIKPQELAVLNLNTGQCIVKEVASLGTLAWKTGYFSFKTVRLDEIMESVANHYGVGQIQYERESLRSQKLSAYITTERSLAEVLEWFEATTGLNIENNNGIIYIKEHK
ncbi:FecR family protein [Pedobacter africanus]|uniref:Ferric-dicitrate binding protein FerR (Iron transport regulator) n=1 Tax=Pedobacter africanus TaxID=151894 RepID=A0ACC6KT49_9SPHI|nr:FecR domain-containing protein [Pedobacter africanus]MDR6782325.1 ferric-dicitrate binding protein FerR (iron transport regulator) [Pedobacter africanus]